MNKELNVLLINYIVPLTSHLKSLFSRGGGSNFGKQHLSCLKNTVAEHQNVFINFTKVTQICFNLNRRTSLGCFQNVPFIFCLADSFFFFFLLVCFSPPNAPVFKSLGRVKKQYLNYQAFHIGFTLIFYIDLSLHFRGYLAVRNCFSVFLECIGFFLASQPGYQLLNAIGSTHLLHQELASESSILAETIHFIY